MRPDESEPEAAPASSADLLRALRSRRGLTGTRLAQSLGWPQSKVSKVENRRQILSESEATAWAKACGAAPASIHHLLALVSEERTEQRSWRHRIDHGRSAVQADYSRLEQASSLNRYFETSVIPGLLQIPEYAQSVLEEAIALNGAVEGETVTDAVTARMARQPALYTPGKKFYFLIGESALRRYTCAPHIMERQLDRLLSVVDLHGVSLGVVPTTGQQKGLVMSSFSLFDSTAIVETLTSEIIYRGAGAEPYASAFRILADQALYGDSARRSIERARHGLAVDRGHAPTRRPRPLGHHSLITAPRTPVQAHG